VRGRIGFFCEGKEVPFHKKEEVEKTRERREKTTPLAVLVYVVFVV
jgi:hypothetical protein